MHVCVYYYYYIINDTLNNYIWVGLVIFLRMLYKFLLNLNPNIVCLQWREKPFISFQYMNKNKISKLYFCVLCVIIACVIQLITTPHFMLQKCPVLFHWYFVYHYFNSFFSSIITSKTYYTLQKNVSNTASTTEKLASYHPCLLVTCTIGRSVVLCV